jgi:hypothetical protein
MLLFPSSAIDSDHIILVIKIFVKLTPRKRRIIPVPTLRGGSGRLLIFVRNEETA